MPTRAPCRLIRADEKRKAMKDIIEHNTTAFGGTETTEGFIPHIRIVYADGVLNAPVKLDVPKRGTRVLCAPLRLDGNLVYALPGGREVVA